MPNQSRKAESFFVGRQEQIKRFNDRFSKSLNDSYPLSIFNIWGIEGVGKSTLVRHIVKNTDASFQVSWASLPEETGEVYVSDVPSMLQYVAEELAPLDWKFKDFQRSFADWLAGPNRQMASNSGLDIAADFTSAIDPWLGLGVKTVGKAVTGLATQRKEISRRQHWTQDPIGSLTRIFTSALVEQCQKRKLGIIIDDYDDKRVWLEKWLIHWTNELSKNEKLGLTLVLITHRSLAESSAWASHTGLFSIPISPFTPQETQVYCDKNEITGNPELLIELHEKTTGLPLYLSTTIGKPLTEIPNFSEESIKKYLSQVDDPEIRLMMVQGAIPRFFDLDVLTALFGADKAKRLFYQLTEMRFVRRQNHKDRGPKWVYHNAVRYQFLRHCKEASQKEWAELHCKLGDYYEARLFKTHPEASAQGSADSTDFAEMIYHHCCQNYPLHFVTGVEAIWQSLARIWDINPPALMALSQAERDTNIPIRDRWGKKILDRSANGEVLTGDDLVSYVMKNIHLCQEIRSIPGIDKAVMASTCAREGLFYSALATVAEALEIYTTIGVPDARVIKAVERDELVQKALELHQQAIFFDPLNAEYHAWLGSQYKDVNDFSKALDEIKQAHQLDPENWEYFFLLGDCYRAAGNKADAIIWLEKGMQFNQNLDAFYACLGNVHADNGELDQAIAYLRQAVEKKPDNSLYYAQLGNYFRETGKLSEAVECFSAGINFVADNVVSLLTMYQMRAMTYYDMNLMDKALSDFAYMLEVAPDYFLVHQSRGAIFYQMEKYQEAIDEFDIIVKAKTAGFIEYALRGKSHYMLGNYPLAIQDLSRAVDLDPNDVEKLVLLGKSYKEIPSYKKALEMFGRVLKIDPKNREALLYRGIIYSMEEFGLYQKAVDDFTVILEDMPNHEEALFYKCDSNFHLGNWEQVIADSSTAIALGSTNPSFFSIRGPALFYTERYSEAILDLTKAIELDPPGLVYQYLRAFCYHKTGNHVRAITDFLNLNDSQFQNILVYICRGKSYQELGMHAEAIADFTSAIDQTDSGSVRIDMHIARGRSYSALGELALANMDSFFAASILSKETGMSLNEILNQVKNGENRLPDTN